MTRKDSIRDEVYHFLKYSHTAVIATSFNDEPSAATVYYGVDDNFNFYFITLRNTTKYIQTCLNHQVAIVVNNGTKQIQVQARGMGDILVEETEREKAIRLIEFQAGKPMREWPISKLEKFNGRRPVAFKIAPTELVFMNIDGEMYPYSKGMQYHTIISQ